MCGRFCDLKRVSEWLKESIAGLSPTERVSYFCAAAPLAPTEVSAGQAVLFGDGFQLDHPLFMPACQLGDLCVS